MAPAKSAKLMVNAIIRETLSSTDKERLAWTGNVLLLSSSLQPELAPDLGGVTGYALEPLLQVICNSSSSCVCQAVCVLHECPGLLVMAVQLAPDLGGVTGYALEPLLQVICSSSSSCFCWTVCYM
jgi:hypothetical protein